MVVDHGAGARAGIVSCYDAYLSIGNVRESIGENKFGVALGHIGAAGALRRAKTVMPVGAMDRVIASSEP